VKVLNGKKTKWLDFFIQDGWLGSACGKNLTKEKLFKKKIQR